MCFWEPKIPRLLRLVPTSSSVRDSEACVSFRDKFARRGSDSGCPGAYTSTGATEKGAFIDV